MTRTRTTLRIAGVAAGVLAAALVAEQGALAYPPGQTPYYSTSKDVVPSGGTVRVGTGNIDNACFVRYQVIDAGGKTKYSTKRSPRNGQSGVRLMMDYSAGSYLIRITVYGQNCASTGSSTFSIEVN